MCALVCLRVVCALVCLIRSTLASFLSRQPRQVDVVPGLSEADLRLEYLSSTDPLTLWSVAGQLTSAGVDLQISGGQHTAAH